MKKFDRDIIWIFYNIPDIKNQDGFPRIRSTVYFIKDKLPKCNQFILT